MTKIGLRLTVVSDYLHFSGVEDYSVTHVDAQRIIDEFLRGGDPRELLGKVRRVMKLPRDKRGVVIPGNTIRGMARSRLELLLRSADYPATQYRVRGDQRAGPSATYMNLFKPRFKPQKAISCVKDLFGEATRKDGNEEARASRVMFSDFVLPSAEAEKYVSLEEKSLPRGMPIEIEVAKKGAIFEGFMLGDGLSKFEIGMLAFALGYAGRGQWKVRLLGMYKYSDKQYGRVRFSSDYAELDSCYEEFMKRCGTDIVWVEEDWK